MGFFDFLFHNRPSGARRRRTPTGPFEGLKAETAAKPLPSLKTTSRFKTPSSTTATLSNSGTIDGLGPDVAPASPAKDAPNSLHYALVHEALRATAFENPTLICGTLTSGMGTPFLRSLVDGVRDAEITSNFTIEAIRLHKLRVGRFPCLIIEMPPPEQPREAYFAAILLMADSKTPLHHIGVNHLRFFTLERTADAGDPTKTVFCEWNEAGGRRSYGDGPSPTVDRFLHALSGMAGTRG